MTVLNNRRAGFDYEILETFEAGIVLTGSEVKSLREGGGSIAQAFARVRSGEIYLEGLNIQPYRQASYNNHEPVHPRKLLLNKSEINEIRMGLDRRGLTVVPLKLYFKGGWAKVQIALARGRKRHDKRSAQAERDAKRQMEIGQKHR